MTKQGIHYEFFVDDKSAAAFNKINANLMKMEDHVQKLESEWDKNTTKMAKKTRGLKDGVKSLAMEFPLLGQAVRLATSPLGIAALAIVGIGAALHHGVQKAKEFDHTFLEVKNLNLDKTDAQIKKLRNSVLDLSFEKGLDPEKTARAFFDVQSATGKYGKEVEDIVGKIGVFSMAMKLDFNEGINGAVKAMRVFGFGAEELDGYLASSAYTVQLGITTFGELAKVQTEFAGAAGAAGQNYDAANKAFAIFTGMSKNVDIAATNTKGFFEDLTKLEKIDIDVFKDDGSFRRMDDIIGDVNNKFKKLNDASISKLIEKVGGNEGLRGMLKQVQLQGDEVLQLFEDFDNQEFDFDKALENANGNLETMSQIVDNKLSAAWIRLGDTVTPILIDIKSWMADAMDWVGNFATEMHRAWTWWTDGQAGLDKLDTDDAVRRWSSEYSTGVEDQLNQFATKEDKIGYLDREIEQEKFSLESDKELYNRYASDPDRYMTERFGENWKQERERTTGEEVMDALGFYSLRTDRLDNERNKYLHDDKQAQEAKIMSMNENLAFLEEKKNLLMNEDESILDPRGGGSGSATSDSIAGVNVAGASVRHVTINIENLVRDTTINAATAEGGLNDLADQVVEIFVRAVRDAELTVSSD